MKNKVLFVVLSAILVLVCFFSLQAGSFFISFRQIVRSVVHFFCRAELSVIDKIVVFVRLPRIMLSLLVGCTLAVSGAVYQTLLRNNLAEPFTLGVSSGATFGVALSLLLAAQFKFHVPKVVFAFFGGLTTIAILGSMIFYKNCSLYTLIFIGISVSYFFNALITLVMSFLGDKSYEILLWMFGTFSNPPDIFGLFVFTVLFLLIMVFLQRNSRTLDLFYLSDDTVRTSGVDPGLTRILFLCAVSAATIYSVSLCGIIGFVGLVVPHIAGLLFGRQHRMLLPSSCLLGGILMVLSDTIARGLPMLLSGTGRELPVGVVTSLIGVPCFIFILSGRMHNVG